MPEIKENYKLIVTIVNKGSADHIVEVTKEAGADGGTIVYGRGTGVHEKQKLFSMLIEPEKEIILTLVKDDEVKKVLDAIVTKGELNKPGKGITFVMDVEKTSGISHNNSE